MWKDRIGMDVFSDRVPVTDLFAELPVALLERVDD